MLSFFIRLVFLSSFAWSINGTPDLELSPSELESIQKKGVATQAIKIKDATWPRLKIKTLIKASPLSSVAIFAAYDYQKNYIPNLEVSSIEKVTSPTEIQVRYQLKMPWPLSPGKYVNNHILSSKGPDHYRVAWRGITNSSAEEVEGQATFVPYKNDPSMTLMLYESRVVPKSFFAGIFRKIMIRDVEKSVKSVVHTVNTLSAQKSKLMLTYETKVLQALKGVPPYAK